MGSEADSAGARDRARRRCGRWATWLVDSALVAWCQRSAGQRRSHARAHVAGGAVCQHGPRLPRAARLGDPDHIPAQIVAALGWGAWFPWSVPALFSGLAGPRAAQVGLQSYVLVALTCAAGLVGTVAWWHSADQTR